MSLLLIAILLPLVGGAVMPLLRLRKERVRCLYDEV